MASHGLGRPKAWNFILLLLSSVGAVWGSRRPVDLVHTAIWVIIAWQAAIHHRHVAFLGISFAFWCLPHVQDFLDDRRFRFPESGADSAESLSRSPSSLRAGIIGSFVVAALLMIKVAPQLTRIAVPKDVWPVNALEFMATNGLDRGRIVVTFGWAQYTLGAFGHPYSSEKGIVVAFDGRFRTCYSQETLDRYLDFELGDTVARYRSPSSLHINPQAALEFGFPDLALIARTQSTAVQTMQQTDGNWLLLYQDKIAPVWGRTAIFGHADSPRYVPPAKREVSERIDIGLSPWPSYPSLARRRRE